MDNFLLVFIFMCFFSFCIFVFECLNRLVSRNEDIIVKYRPKINKVSDEIIRKLNR